MHKTLLVGPVANGIRQLQSYLRGKKIPKQNKKQQTKEKKKGTEREDLFLVAAWEEK